jgi:surface polysaccharide O-acyltransferase-like enzyme
VGIVFIHAYGSNIGLADGNIGIYRLVGPALFIQYYFSHVLARISVPLFYLMSGFLFYDSFDGSINKYYNKLKSRIRTLFIPFLFWNLLTLFVLAILQANSITSRYFSGKFAPVSSFNAYDFLNAIFGFTRNPIAYQFWFIRDLMLLVILSPILYWTIRHIPRLTLFLLFYIWALSLNPLYAPSSEATLFFFIGGLIGCTTARLDLFDKYAKLLFVAYICLSIIELLTMNMFYNIYLHNINIIIGIIATIWLSGIINRKMIKISKILKLLSPAAFFIFATHEPLLTVIRKLSYVIINPSNSIIVIIIYFSDIFITIMLCIILYFILTKISLSFMRVICGGR